MRRKKDSVPEGFVLSKCGWINEEEREVTVIALGKCRVRNPTQMAYPYKLLRTRPKEGDRIKVVARSERTNNELSFTADVRVLKSNPNYGYLNFRRSNQIQKGDNLFILQIEYIKMERKPLSTRPNEKIDLG